MYTIFVTNDERNVSILMDQTFRINAGLVVIPFLQKAEMLVFKKNDHTPPEVLRKFEDQFGEKIKTNGLYSTYKLDISYEDVFNLLSKLKAVEIVHRI